MLALNPKLFQRGSGTVGHDAHQVVNPYDKVRQQRRKKRSGKAYIWRYFWFSHWYKPTHTFMTVQTYIELTPMPPWTAEHIVNLWLCEANPDLPVRLDCNFGYVRW